MLSFRFGSRPIPESIVAILKHCFVLLPVEERRNRIELQQLIIVTVYSCLGSIWSMKPAEEQSIIGRERDIPSLFEGDNFCLRQPVQPARSFLPVMINLRYRILLKSDGGILAPGSLGSFSKPGEKCFVEVT